MTRACLGAPRRGSANHGVDRHEADAELKPTGRPGSGEEWRPPVPPRPRTCLPRRWPGYLFVTAGLAIPDSFVRNPCVEPTNPRRCDTVCYRGYQYAQIWNRCGSCYAIRNGKRLRSGRRATCHTSTSTSRSCPASFAGRGPTTTAAASTTAAATTATASNLGNRYPDAGASAAGATSSAGPGSARRRTRRTRRAGWRRSTCRRSSRTGPRSCSL